MSNNAVKIGWIGAGRMGMPMIERLLKAGHDVTIWNRTRAKAEPLAGKGGKLVNKPADLAGCDVVFCHRLHRQGCRGGSVRQGRSFDRRRQAENGGRLLVDLGRGIRRDPQAAETRKA